MPVQAQRGWSQVPFPVELSVGPSWGQLSKVSLEQLAAQYPGPGGPDGAQAGQP
jgi:hypothetical protein